MIQSFPLLKPTHADDIFPCIDPVLGKDLSPPSGLKPGIADAQGIIGNEDLFMKITSHVFLQMLRVQNDRIAQGMFRGVGQVLDPTVPFGEIPPLSSPDYLSPQERFHDEVGREQVVMSHIHKHDDHVYLLPVHKPGDITN